MDFRADTMSGSDSPPPWPPKSPPRLFYFRRLPQRCGNAQLIPPDSHPQSRPEMKGGWRRCGYVQRGQGIPTMPSICVVEGGRVVGGPATCKLAFLGARGGLRGSASRQQASGPSFIELRPTATRARTGLRGRLAKRRLGCCRSALATAGSRVRFPEAPVEALASAWHRQDGGQDRGARSWTEQWHLKDSSGPQRGSW